MSLCISATRCSGTCVKSATRAMSLCPCRTQQDMSALFWARGAERYLKPGGTIAFVLPYAAINRPAFGGLRPGISGASSAHHRGYAISGSVQVRIVEAWDLAGSGQYSAVQRSARRRPACCSDGESRRVRSRRKSSNSPALCHDVMPAKQRQTPRCAHVREPWPRGDDSGGRVAVSCTVPKRSHTCFRAASSWWSAKQQPGSATILLLRGCAARPVPSTGHRGGSVDAAARARSRLSSCARSCSARASRRFACLTRALAVIPADEGSATGRCGRRRCRTSASRRLAARHRRQMDAHCAKRSDGTSADDARAAAGSHA